MSDKRKTAYGGYITPSYKRAIRDGISDPIKQDFTVQAVNEAIYKILGRPGVSGGRAQEKLNNSISSGMGTSAYNSGQMDHLYSGDDIDVPSKKDSGIGMSWLDTAIASVVNVGRDLLGYYHADKAAKVAYERQEESYNNHFSMPAKVNEYEEAGLNPMALAGAGTGVSSTPNVSQGDTPSLGDMSGLLGALLNYKTRMAEIDVAKDRVQAYKEDTASKIEYRAQQKIYQEKVNEWFDTNQIVSIDKQVAETQLAYEKLNTEVTQQQLNEAGVTKAEADAALSFQLALQKEFENSPEYRQNTLRLQRAQASQYEADAAHLYEDIKNLAEERNEIVSRVALNYANTDLGRQQLKNLGLQEKQIQFAVDHQKGDLVFQRINQVTGALKDVGIAAGGIASVVNPLGGVGSLLGGVKPQKKIGFEGPKYSYTVPHD